MKAIFGDSSCIDSWMQLVRRVSPNFPGLETEESLDEHKQTVLKFINKNQALCVRDGEKVVGVLLFSRMSETGKRLWVCFFFHETEI